MSSPAVVCSGLSFVAGRHPVLRALDVAFGAGRTGLVGANGCGKSTLLRLIAGRLRPSAGTITTAGDVGYLPQDVALDTGRTVAELLGIAEQRAALHAVEAGDAGAIAAVGDGWDIEERAVGELARLGLQTDLDRRRLAVRRGGAHRAGRPPRAQAGGRAARRTDEQPRPRRCRTPHRGAGRVPRTILVASHDVPFLRRIGCTRWWSVDGGLHEVAHPGRR